MDIQQVLNQLDNLFAEKQIMKVEPFLQQQISIATDEGDVESLITLLNESIGFYRDTSQYDKSMSCCSEVKELMVNLGLEGTVPYATTLLNIANAARAAGRYEESMSNYAQVFDIYDHHLENADFRYASLYNNLSLLYQEMGDFERAAQALERALEIVVLYPEARIELATTHTNLASSLLRINQLEQAKEHLHAALELFEQDEKKDYHYSAALSAMGELMFQEGAYQEATDYIKHAMAELESHVGKTENYWRLSDNLEVIEKKIAEQKIQKIPQKLSDDRKTRIKTDEDMTAEEKQSASEVEDMTDEQLMEELIENGISDETLAKLLNDQYGEEDLKKESTMLENSELQQKEISEKNEDSKISQDLEKNDCESTNDVEQLQDTEKQQNLTGKNNVELFRDMNQQSDSESMKKTEYQSNTESLQNIEEYRNTESLQDTKQQSKTESLQDIEKQSSQDDIKSKAEPIQLSDIDNGMQLSKAYFEKFGKDMLQHFSQLQNRYAVGCVGEGSECFGFDDEISRDHDFGPGFSIWLTQEEYEQYGEELAQAYNTLPKTLCEKSEQSITDLTNMERIIMPQGTERVGVQSIDGFYKRILGTSTIPFSDALWLQIPEELLATAVNGSVFEDGLQEFSKIRSYIMNYYPEQIWRKRLAQELALMAQTGQYNYARMLARQEYVAAQIQLADFMKYTMKTVYLLNKVYAPHDKWLQKGMRKLQILPEIADMLDSIYMLSMDEKNKHVVLGQNQVTRMIEIVAKLIVDELKKQHLSKSHETYLGVQAELIAQIKSDERKEETMNKEQLVDEIVQLEWKAFDQVKNEGGRADCQDDWGTFQIMRKSQYLTWTEEMLTQYHQDFIEANARGWNLITEKYARMMESTAKKKFDELKDNLPTIPEDKKVIMEQIIQIQVGWMEDFAKVYPYMAGNARCIHSSEDTPFQTSFETYLRGEMGTYSDRMLELYGRFIVSKAQKHDNLTKKIMTNTALLYGYESLDDAEIRLAKQ